MAEVGIFVGTMYGNSLLVAEEAEAILSGLGHKATVYEDPQVNDWESYTGKYVLVVTSTTGQGDLPDSIVPLYEGIKDMYQPSPAVRHYRARRQHLCQLSRRRPEVRSAAAGAGREAHRRDAED